jgi:hypothetical protein
MKTLYQIFSTVAILIMIMCIPYLIGLNLRSEKLSHTPEISKQASVSSYVLGISDYRNLNDDQVIDIQLVFGGILIFLILCVVFSILHRKQIRI